MRLPVLVKWLERIDFNLNQIEASPRPVLAEDVAVGFDRVNPIKPNARYAATAAVCRWRSDHKR